MYFLLLPVSEGTLRPHPTKAGHENELGVQGLSLHYANVISAIDRMVRTGNPGQQALEVFQEIYLVTTP